MPYQPGGNPLPGGESITSSGSDPTHALVKAMLIDTVDSTDWLELMFNPKAVQTVHSQAVGQLQPVGWSHAILHSGHVKSVPISFEVYLTQLGAEVTAKGGVQKPRHIQESIAWIEGCVYSRSSYLSSPVLRLDWGMSLFKNIIILSVGTARVFFSKQLDTLTAALTVSALEIRKGFKTWYTHRSVAGRGEPGEDYSSVVFSSKTTVVGGK